MNSKQPKEAIRDHATFVAGWWVLGLLLVGFFVIEPLGVPISAIAAVCAALLYVIAARGHVIGTTQVLKEAPWQVVVFSLGMYLVVYGLKNAGLTDYIAQLLNIFCGAGFMGGNVRHGAAHRCVVLDNE